MANSSPSFFNVTMLRSASVLVMSSKEGYIDMISSADIPDFFEILGSIIISLSGLFIIYREYKIGLRPYVSKESRVRDVINRGH